MKQRLKIWWIRSLANGSMGYYGDAYDSPPLIIRIVTTVVCTAGAVILLWHLIPGGQIVAAIITVGGLCLAAYLLWIVPRSGQTALVTMAYWALLIYFALFLPLGL